MSIRTFGIVFLTAFLVAGSAITIASLSVKPAHIRARIKATESEPVRSSIPLEKVDTPSALLRGVLVGGVVGIVCVAFWYQFGTRVSDTPQRIKSPRWKILEGVVWSIILGGICVGAFFYGQAAATTQSQNADLRIQIKIAEGILTSKLIYQNVQIDTTRSKKGYLYLNGFVEQQQLLNWLESELIYALGEDRAKRAIEGVRISEP